MTIKRASIAIAAAGALALGAASPVMATTAQAKQIKTLKLELVKADKTIAARNTTIAARNKTIAADNTTIGLLRARPPVVLSGITTSAQAWSELVTLTTSGLFWPNSFSQFCNGITQSWKTDTQVWSTATPTDPYADTSTTLSFTLDTTSGLSGATACQTSPVGS